ncbi:MAG: hypothetical protein V7K94_27220 [Nostoc sp.]|uniref:hypothetical protein n=1 Tax=Nostoc sp. TaxID=1180 RepID=UPI002FFADF42
MGKKEGSREQGAGGEELLIYCPIPNPQSPIPNPQSPIPNSQSPIPNPQSPIPNYERYS